MPDTILVTYATSHGSTQEVAEAVAAALREMELTVDIQPARKVRSLEGYSAVVLGAPLYMFRWHKDARRFLARHQKALVKRPAAVFALGPFYTGDEAEFQGSREQLDKELAEFPWFAPVDVVIFGGKFELENLHFSYRMFMKEIPATDLRDWAAIRDWANSLPAKLR
ncbi:MAG: flavodoxin [Anaerolineae bacterium]|nr:flavodoxin [Anaerolineae bacterium]